MYVFIHTPEELRVKYSDALDTIKQSHRPGMFQQIELLFMNKHRKEVDFDKLYKNFKKKDKPLFN